MDHKKQNSVTPVHDDHVSRENKHDLEMNRNTNERANENVNENSFDEDNSANDVGSEITDGEAG
jgi:hypothetical protein